MSEDLIGSHLGRCIGYKCLYAGDGEKEKPVVACTFKIKIGDAEETPAPPAAEGAPAAAASPAAVPKTRMWSQVFFLSEAAAPYTVDRLRALGLPETATFAGLWKGEYKLEEEAELVFGKGQPFQKTDGSIEERIEITFINRVGGIRGSSRPIPETDVADISKRLARAFELGRAAAANGEVAASAPKNGKGPRATAPTAKPPVPAAGADDDIPF